MPDGEHDVLGSPDEVRLLVIEHEMRHGVQLALHPADPQRHP